MAPRPPTEVPVKSFVPTVFAALLLAATPTAAQENARVIAVDGSATISVTPDRATLRMAAQARNESLDTARAEVVRVTRAFLEFAGDKGMDDDDIQTSGLNIRPEYRWNNDENRQVLLGYFVQRDIVVELRDLDSLGEIMEGAVDVGINQVQPPMFRHSESRKLRRQALARAAEDARANAQQIAKTLDMRLGNVRRLVATETNLPQPQLMRAMAVAEDAAVGGADTYSTGRISIEARVQAEFDLE
jgi:uncharacterized protein YggE